VKQAVYFAGACAGIVLWHLPTTAACFARTVEGSYTCTEGGAVPAPMHSGLFSATGVSTVPAVFGGDEAVVVPASSVGDENSEADLRAANPFAFVGHEPLVEPR
jgi:hypothetical protein